jgi:hypothetical protein
MAVWRWVQYRAVVQWSNLHPDPEAYPVNLLERHQETHRPQGCPLGSERQYGELKGLPQRLMTVGEHEYH